MPKHLFSLLCLGLGIFLLVQVMMPMISYKVWEWTSYQQNMALVSPDLTNKSVLGVSVKDTNSFPAFISDKISYPPAPFGEFTLSIPSIKLEDAKVLVDSNNFDQTLAHFAGSAYPGERGNMFITGHSSLPQFYRPGNYKAIFSNLPDIKRGDEIYIEAGGRKFVYLVTGLKIVDPKDTWVLNPPEPMGRYISLMTCVPPGLYLKRLIVLGELQ